MTRVPVFPLRREFALADMPPRALVALIAALVRRCGGQVAIDVPSNDPNPTGELLASFDGHVLTLTDRPEGTE